MSCTLLTNNNHKFYYICESADATSEMKSRGLAQLQWKQWNLQMLQTIAN